MRVSDGRLRLADSGSDLGGDEPRASQQGSLGPSVTSQAGFAITELLMVILLLSIVLGAILSFLEVAARVAPKHQERGHVIQEGQVGLERMTRELRQASIATIASTPSPPATPTSQEITFTTYVRVDGGAAVKRQVSYRCSYQNDDCWRYEGAVGQSPATLAATDRLAAGVLNDPVTTPVFIGTPSAASPRYVEATLALKSEGSGQPIYLRDGVEMRNVGG